MDKLRSSYSKYQTEVFADNPRFVSSDKAAKLSNYAEIELQKMRNKNDFANYQQGTFYKQKFSKLADVASKLEGQRISDQIYHKSVRQIMQDNFLTNAQVVPNPPRQSLNRSPNFTLQNPQIQKSRGRSKSPLEQFFDDQGMKKSKAMTFSNLLSRQEVPLKYGLRSVSRNKSPSVIPRNDEELRFLQEENRRLREKLNSQKTPNPDDNERLRELKSRLRQLDEENRRLKTQVSKSQKSDFIVEQEYDPYNLKVRENDIVKIHNKNLYLSEKMSQFGGLSEDFNMERKSPKVYYDNQSDHIRSDITPKQSSAIRSKNYVDNQDLLNASQSTIQTQFLNLEESQLYDDQRNQICRQKIAFFKKSMVLVKTPDFDIAYKRSDFNFQMDKLRLILYVNNKGSRKFNCTIEYDYDHQDFDIIVKKRLAIVEPRSQGRQEIQITLKNASDLGSLINAKILVGDKMKKIIVPALFIDFDDSYKYQFENVGYIQRNLSQPLVIRPMSQFSTIDKTNNVLQLTRQYQQKYQVAKLYGKSKACKGMVKLTWKKSNKLKIETCEEWRTLMGYLFLNAEETINY